MPQPSPKQQFDVEVEQDATRLDVLVSEKLGISRSKVKKMIDEGKVLVNDKEPRKAGDIVRMTDTISIIENVVPKKIAKTTKAETKIFEQIEVLEETPDYIIVNKPSALLVHPTQAGEPHTLASWIVQKYPEIEGVGESAVRPGIVHRLDKDTSGILVIARTQKMFEHLKQQFKDRTVEKMYRVLVYGQIEIDKGVIDFEIDRGSQGKMVSRPKTDKLKLKNVGKYQDGKEALTEFEVEQRFVRFTLLKVHIHTGRTNQIRVHMFAYGHPVVGDTLYMNKKLIKKGEQHLNRLFLCAQELSFTDLHGERKKYHIELPQILQDYLNSLT
jgi:23S rRNA pseudouridine1911/1915/1917 synthase